MCDCLMQKRKKSCYLHTGEKMSLTGFCVSDYISEIILKIFLWNFYLEWFDKYENNMNHHQISTRF